MRITYLHQYFTTPEGTGGTRSYEMGVRLAKAGHHVNIITSVYDRASLWPKWNIREVDGMTVHSIEVPYSNSMSYPRRIWAFFIFALLSTIRAAQLPADVVFASSSPLTIAIPGRIAAKLRRAPYVLEVLDLWPSVPIALGALKGRWAIRAAYALEHWAYRGATRIVVAAPGMKRHVEKAHFPSDRIVIIPNGCDPTGFAHHASAFDLRTQYDWLGSRPLVVYAGTIGLVNGVDWLVEVAAQTLLLDSQIRFAVIGGGREYETVLNRARELGVLNNNFFMLGAVPKRTSDAWVCTADSAISLIVDREYLWENAVTNKFFDALSAGRPIMSNHPGYQTEVAIEASAGIMLDQHNHALAARQLVEALRSHTWITGAGQASNGLATTVFERDRLASKLEATLKRAMNDCRVRSNKRQRNR